MIAVELELWPHARILRRLSVRLGLGSIFAPLTALLSAESLPAPPPLAGPGPLWCSRAPRAPPAFQKTTSSRLSRKRMYVGIDPRHGDKRIRSRFTCRPWLHVVSNVVRIIVVDVSKWCLHVTSDIREGSILSRRSRAQHHRALLQAGPPIWSCRAVPLRTRGGA